MCGRFALGKETDELIAEFVAAGGDFREWRPSWNIRPTDTVPIVVTAAPSGQTPVRRLAAARWSLVPPWSKTLKLGYPTFNARAEGITQKATWKHPVQHQRALIPADGYYEWQTDPQSGAKTPYYLHPGDGSVLAFAGLYSWWRNPAGSDGAPDRWVLTATMLTSAAVDELVHIHDRNPVPLPRDMWDDWLDPSHTGDQTLVDAAVAAALPVAAALHIRPVRPLRNDTNGPELTAEADPGAAPTPPPA